MINISEYAELLALHQTLLEARFHPDPENVNVAWSPIISDLHKKVVACLAELETRRKKRDPTAWEDWRKLANRTHFRELAVQRAIDMSEWKQWDSELQEYHSSNLLSPFSFSREELKDFIEEVSMRAKAKSQDPA